MKKINFLTRFMIDTGLIKKVTDADRENEVIEYLAENRERAEAIIEAAFPGYRLGKFRKDKGQKKVKGELA